MPKRDNTEKYLSLICDWIDTKEICLEKHNFSKDELVNFCQFCDRWIKKDLANQIICAVMNKIIDQK
jgi:hypothetical protein